MTLTAHPYAEKFPMLPASELADLAESIAANGLRNPVVLTEDGQILDGRNRYAACQQVGIEPATVTYEGEDFAEYVIDCNVTRRNMSTGARAMSMALVLDADGRRVDGRVEYGALSETLSGSGHSLNRQRLNEAFIVLDFKPDLAPEVVAGDLTLNAAFAEADAIRTSAEREKIMARELAKRQKQEAADLAEKNARIITDLTQAGSKYVALIEDGTFEPASAWAAHLEDTRKERKHQDEIEQGIRSTVTRIAECVRFLEGGEAQAAIFLDNFYPHEARILADGMRLTRQRVQSCIDFLTAVQKEITA